MARRHKRVPLSRLARGVHVPRNHTAEGSRRGLEPAMLSPPWGRESRRGLPVAGGGAPTATDVDGQRSAGDGRADKAGLGPIHELGSETEVGSKTALGVEVVLSTTAELGLAGELGSGDLR